MLSFTLLIFEKKNIKRLSKHYISWLVTLLTSFILIRDGKYDIYTHIFILGFT